MWLNGWILAPSPQIRESVLLSLGYQPDEIGRSFKALAARPEDAETSNSEIILREALRWLAQTV